LIQYLNQSKHQIDELSLKLQQLVEQKHRGHTWIHGLELAINKEMSLAHLDNNQIRDEALFFQEYQQKTTKELLTYLLNSPHLSTRKHLSKLFRNHRYLFSLKNLSVLNIKRILLRVKSFTNQSF
jgi:hypothetical protein